MALGKHGEAQRGSWLYDSGQVQLFCASVSYKTTRRLDNMVFEALSLWWFGDG